MPDEAKLKELLKRVQEVAGFCGTEVKDVNARSSSEDQPIHVVAFWGNVSELKTLLEFGADINSKGEDGYTPLHEAIDQDNHEAVKFLLKRGANPSIKNDDGDTPLEFARSFEKKKIMELFSELNNT